MIKLIASDIDGTLLPKGQKTIDEDTLRVVSEILDNGIEFCAISGRPRNSVMNLFAPVADRIWVISDNGTILWEKGRTNKIAQLFEVPVETLLDDYNLFLWKGQGEQIKTIRTKLGLTQREYADKLSVSLGSLKQWEQNRKQIFKSTWEKYFKQT